MLIKQETVLGQGTQAENSRVKEPKRIALPVAYSLKFYGDIILSPQVPGLSLSSHFVPGSFPLAHSSLSQDKFHEKGF